MKKSKLIVWTLFCIISIAVSISWKYRGLTWEHFFRIIELLTTWTIIEIGTQNHSTKRFVLLRGLWVDIKVSLFQNTFVRCYEAPFKFTNAWQRNTLMTMSMLHNRKRNVLIVVPFCFSLLMFHYNYYSFNFLFLYIFCDLSLETKI